MTRLRIALAPLGSLDLDSEVAFAWLDRQGQVREQGRSSLRCWAKAVRLFLWSASFIPATAC